MRRPLALPLLVLLALPLGALAGGPTDPLSLVPPDATAVGMLRVSDVRTSPWAARFFSEADHVTIDGDGARFLAEARLRPTEDVDTVVFAGTPGSDGTHGTGIAVFEGRFDAESVTAALLSRGATKTAVAGGTLLILPDKPGEGSRHRDGEPGALAFLGRHLAVAGPQAAVEAALARAASSSRADFRTGAGLGRHYARVSGDATGWILVDLGKQQMKSRKVHVEGEVSSDSGARQVIQVAGLMKQVPLLAMSMTMKRDAVKLHAFGLCDDAETRDLLEDSLRGLMAAWRLSVQDKSPDLLPILRSFKVDQSKDGVSLTGTIPGTAMQAFLDRKERERAR